MCLAADIPLVESGTAGYLGQVTVIKKVLYQMYNLFIRPFLFISLFHEHGSSEIGGGGRKKNKNKNRDSREKNVRELKITRLKPRLGE